MNLDYQRHRRVEGEAPSGFAGGGGDASPLLLKLLIAGGGTGGHIYSGLAVAEEWIARGGEVVFVGTPKGMESKLVPPFGIPLLLIQVSALKGRSFWDRFKALLKIPTALMASYKLLKQVQPDIVLGIGGYASGPVTLMARILGYKTAVLDQNSIPGMTRSFSVSFLRSRQRK